MAEVDILGPSERRRTWGAQEKAALLAEVDTERGKVRLVARRHVISASLLYNWRSACKAAAVAAGTADNVKLRAGRRSRGQSAAQTSAVGVPGASADAGAATSGRQRQVDEITLARVSVDAFVNERALSRVLRNKGTGMISLAPGTEGFLACRPIYFRNGFDGLAAKAQQVIGAYPFSGHLFIFRGKRGDYLKGLYWDGTGMQLIAKRLEKGRFVWPSIVDGSMSLTLAQFSILVEAMDWRRTIAPPPTTQPLLV